MILSRKGKFPIFEGQVLTSPSGITTKVEAFKSMDLKAFCFPRFDADIADC